jgi:hypothetical protein
MSKSPVNIFDNNDFVMSSVDSICILKVNDKAKKVCTAHSEFRNEKALFSKGTKMVGAGGLLEQ